MWPWGACWLQEWPQEAIDVWRGVAVWRVLSVWSVWRVLGLANGRSYCGPGVLVDCKSGHKKPLMCGAGVSGLANGRSYWCGLMAARWVGLEGFKRLERLERLERFRAGKRQTWTPIRSHWCVALGCGGFESWQTADLGAHEKLLMCGLGVPVGCKSGHKKPLMCGAGWLLAAGWSLDGFRAGKRQKLLMWLDGCKMGWFGGF